MQLADYNQYCSSICKYKISLSSQFYNKWFLKKIKDINMYLPYLLKLQCKDENLEKYVGMFTFLEKKYLLKIKGYKYQEKMEFVLLMGEKEQM